MKKEKISKFHIYFTRPVVATLIGYGIFNYYIYADIPAVLSFAVALYTCALCANTLIK